ncbi:MAG: DUF1365 domain-containing protein [Marinicella sp.]
MTVKGVFKLQPGITQGRVIHHRYLPKVHHFDYQMSWFLIDVDNLSEWDKQSKCLGYNRWSIYSIHDKDYINDKREPIRKKLSDFLKMQGVETHSGQTLLFTHPRFFGFGFNSVSFYFCYNQDRLRYIVSEINNTPWAEKHLYLHDCDNQGVLNKPDTNKYLFKFDKAFHISPFVDMNVQYSWQFEINPEQIKVSMELHRKNVKVLFVHLDADITPVVDNQENWVKLSRMFQPIKMWFGIYWQAFKLWLKKTPFYNHPDKS